jgi:hypothetical protein
VHPDELAESVKDGVRGGAGRDGRHALHLCDGRGRGGHDVDESGDEGLEDYASVFLYDRRSTQFRAVMYVQGKDRGRLRPEGR